MLDFAKKGLYVGLGIASLTKEKLEDFAKEFAEKAKMSEEEGRKFADYLADESKKGREGLKQMVETAVQGTVDRLPYSRKIEKLEARVAVLEELLGKGAGSESEACTAAPPCCDEK